MSGGYTDDGWQGGEQTCGVCGRRTDECGTCRCLVEPNGRGEDGPVQPGDGFGPEYAKEEDSDVRARRER